MQVVSTIFWYIFGINGGDMFMFIMAHLLLHLFGDLPDSRSSPRSSPGTVGTPRGEEALELFARNPFKVDLIQRKARGGSNGPPMGSLGDGEIWEIWKMWEM